MYDSRMHIVCLYIVISIFILFDQIMFYLFLCMSCLFTYVFIHIYVLNNLFMGTMSPKTLHCSREDLSTGFPDRCPSSYRWSTSGNQGNLQMSTRSLATYGHLRGVKGKSDVFVCFLDTARFETAFLWAKEYPTYQMCGGFKPSHIYIYKYTYMMPRIKYPWQSNEA